MQVARAVRNQPATLSTTFYNDESAVSADGSVTVNIVRADGSVLLPAGTASTVVLGVYTYDLSPQAELGYLTVTWTGTFSGITRSNTTYCEIRGNELFSLAEARASDQSLSDATKYSTALLKECRAEVEDEFEKITGVSFVPKFKRTTRDGTGTERLILKQRFVRKLLSATIYGVPFTSQELAAVSPTVYGEIVRTDAGFWTSGYRNLVLEYEYGMDMPPADVRKAALVRLRTRVMETNSGVPSRATSFVAAEGGTYTMATPGRAGYETGIPEVDAVLARYTLNIPGIA
jgi:hypothetical protein